MLQTATRPGSGAGWGSRGYKHAHSKNTFQKAALASKVTQNAGTSGVSRQFYSWTVLWGPEEKRELGLLCFRAPSLTHRGEVLCTNPRLSPSPLQHSIK